MRRRGSPLTAFGWAVLGLGLLWAGVIGWLMWEVVG